MRADLDDKGLVGNGPSVGVLEQLPGGKDGAPACGSLTPQRPVQLYWLHSAWFSLVCGLQSAQLFDCTMHWEEHRLV